jgi:branched-chain amino acid transport system ATP-binding protein
MTGPLLQIERLTKRFGGVIASDAITLDIPRGEFHAIIGPNGAGKTTLIGLLAGEIAPQGGAIRFDGGDITALSTDRRSHLGLARSFQITSLFRDFTALDNVALAVQAHNGHSFRFWNDARRRFARPGASGARARRARRARRNARRQAQSRRAAPARNRHGACHAAAAPAARRADGRHGAG